MSINHPWNHKENQYKAVFHWMIQNRVCLSTTAILVGSLVTVDGSLTPLWVYLRIFIMLYAFVVLNITRYGKGTYKVFHKTQALLHRKLRKWNNVFIPERFFIEAMDWYENWIAIGYCELQWMYLAAKEFGLEKEFFELKAKLTKNKIPNF